MEKNCNIFFTSLEGDQYNDFFDDYLTTLPTALQKRLGQYPRQKDKYLSLAGKFLLSNALIAHGYDDLIAFENFRYTDKGRPYIEDIEADFNISHSGDLVVCAFSTHMKVGIDLQKKLALSKAQANLYFNLIEGANCAEELRADYVINVWTRKEAVSKLVGEGLSINFKQMLIHENTYRAEEQTIYLRNLPLAEGYTSTLASSLESQPQIERIDMHDLIHYESKNV